jgi:hypothetical protein
MYHLLEKANGRSYPLTGAVMEAGRAKDCQISLARDRRVFRRHARFELGDTSFEFLPLSSPEFTGEATQVDGAEPAGSGGKLARRFGWLRR